MTTTEILNATTSVQSRIDTVLATPTLDWANDSGWQPGDPLYGRPEWLRGGQYVRRLFDLHAADHWDRWIFDIDPEEGSWAFIPWSVRCAACEVSWSGPEACWMCGDTATARPERVMAHLSPGTTGWASHVEEWQRLWDETARQAMGSMTEQLDRVREQVAALRRRNRAAAQAEVIRIPEGVEITPVSEVPMPDHVTAFDAAIRSGSVAHRYHLNRPITEQRRHR